MSSNAQQPPPGGRGGRGGRAADFPQRAAADPAIVERGKSIYTINCQFCHGADTRGGDTGPSLLRSQLVQDDQNGEKIGDVVRMPTPRLPMCVPPFVFQK
jgi:mono/diheme cytochrome c family protein